MTKPWNLFKLNIISFLGALLMSSFFTFPSYGHQADLSVAKAIVRNTETQVILALPTSLVAFADNNRDNKLSPDEVRTNQAKLQTFLGDRFGFVNGKGHPGSLTVAHSKRAILSPWLQSTAVTHSTLLLNYTWSEPIESLKIRYALFSSNFPTAHCLATFFYDGKMKNYLFSSSNQELSLNLFDASWFSSHNLAVAIALAFMWGGLHALSPGHGKAIVGAYLVGSHATARDALFLGLITTITHTMGVFVLGIVALFASHFILPDRLYPWLSLLSGFVVTMVGLNLFLRRILPNNDRQDSYSHIDSTHHHHHESDYHHHEHHHYHSHSHFSSSNGEKTFAWRSLLALGISGGLMPCPTALVLLLSTISLRQTGLGLILVLVFSLGLAGTLTCLGLLFVNAKYLIKRIPARIRFPQFLSAGGALLVLLIGLGIMTQALPQIQFFLM